jgi:Family of unknown function (DUF6496)
MPSSSVPSIRRVGSAKNRLQMPANLRMATSLLRGATKEIVMPEKKTIERARKAKREGKAPSTQAGAFVREEIEHIREGKHGAKSAKQAIAIGLSKARRAGVKLPAKGASAKRSSSPSPRKAAKRTTVKKASPGRRKSIKRSRAATQAPSAGRARVRALKRAPRSAASPRALSRQARQAARRRKRSTTARPRAKRATASR